MAKLRLLSFGAGQESTCLLYKYVYDADYRRQFPAERFVVACADTGAEHPETYEHIEYVKGFCAKHSIEFYHVTADMGYHTGDWAGGLWGVFEAKSVVNSVAFPYASCTLSLKITPLYKWFDDFVAREFGYPKVKSKEPLKDFVREFQEKIVVDIGFGKGEEGRAGLVISLQQAFEFAACKQINEPIWMQETITKQFPLIMMGFDRSACQEYIRSVGHTVCAPSACVPCHWKSDADVRWTQLRYPAQFERWVAAEQRKLVAWADDDFRRARQKDKFKPKNEFKNMPVGGKFNDDGTPVTLLQRAETVRKQLIAQGIVSDAEQLAHLDERRMREGHGVKSKAT